MVEEWSDEEFQADARIQALISLLDDNDPLILDQIWDELMGYGSPIINVLESEWERFTDPLFQARVEDLIQEIHFNSIIEKVRNWRNHKLDNLEFFLIIEEWLYPNHSTEETRARLKRIEHELWLGLNPGFSNLKTIKVFLETFHSDFQIETLKEMPSDLQSYCFKRILEGGKLASSSMGILYCAMARGFHLPFYPVLLPYHVIIACYPNLYGQKQIDLFNYESVPDYYFDTLHSGQVFTSKEIDEYLEKMDKVKAPQFYQGSTDMAFIIFVLDEMLQVAIRQGKEHHIQALIQFKSIIQSEED